MAAKSLSNPSHTSVIARAAALAMMMMTRTAHPFAVPPAATLVASDRVVAAVATVFAPTRRRRGVVRAGGESAVAMTTTPPSSDVVLGLSLEKPLGLVLEESDATGGGGGGGVVVAGVNEGGSAYLSPSKDSLAGSTIYTVMGVDVSRSGLDDVMEAIIGAPSPVDISFRVPSTPTTTTTGGGGIDDDSTVAAVTAPTYEVGTTVAIVVQQPSKPDIVIEAKVGDNLRKTLLANDVELYRGLKKKLGNCGGGGQCGFCAVELVDDGGGVWGTRSDYEIKRIGKGGGEGCRLACMNNIVGPATVRTL
jgi:ferredoxin